MRFLPLFVLLGLSAAPSVAETIRVAVARGPRLDVTGRDLLVRSASDSLGVHIGRVGRLEAVGPFVSDGDHLSPLIALEDRSGERVRIGSTGLLGRAEVVALENGLLAIDHVDIETYVASVVGAEMHPSWPTAALEAQAIAARTYVLKKKRLSPPDRPYDVEASVLHQVYKGAGSLDPRTIAAAQNTKGVVLDYGGELADAFFFASCRGQTEFAAAAFGMSAPYLVPTSCDGGEAAPKLTWRRKVPIVRLSAALKTEGLVGDDVASIEIASRTRTGRIERVRALTNRGGVATITGADLRRIVGYTELPSLAAEVTMVDGAVVFDGSGSGHGVGLCQWCAKGRAEAGDSSTTILSRAYPGTTLRRIDAGDDEARAFD